jgi:hypothetical protein
MVTGPAEITHAISNPHSAPHSPDTADHRKHLLNIPEIQNIDQPYGIRTKTPKIILIIALICGFFHFSIHKTLVLFEKSSGKVFFLKDPTHH